MYDFIYYFMVNGHVHVCLRRRKVTSHVFNNTNLMNDMFGSINIYEVKTPKLLPWEHSHVLPMEKFCRCKHHQDFFHENSQNWSLPTDVEL